jgi:hypothetical protein
MVARYDGWCACGCGERIEAGVDVIVRSTDGWTLADCANGQ